MDFYCSLVEYAYFTLSFAKLLSETFAHSSEATTLPFSFHEYDVEPV